VNKYTYYAVENILMISYDLTKKSGNCK